MTTSQEWDGQSDHPKEIPSGTQAEVDLAIVRALQERNEARTEATNQTAPVMPTNDTSPDGQQPSGSNESVIGHETQGDLVVDETDGLPGDLTEEQRAFLSSGSGADIPPYNHGTESQKGSDMNNAWKTILVSAIVAIFATWGLLIVFPGMMVPFALKGDGSTEELDKIEKSVKDLSSKADTTEKLTAANASAIAELKEKSVSCGCGKKPAKAASKPAAKKPAKAASKPAAKKSAAAAVVPPPKPNLTGSCGPGERFVQLDVWAKEAMKLSGVAEAVAKEKAGKDYFAPDSVSRKFGSVFRAEAAAGRLDLDGLKRHVKVTILRGDEVISVLDETIVGEKRFPLPKDFQKGDVMRTLFSDLGTLIVPASDMRSEWGEFNHCVTAINAIAR